MDRILAHAGEVHETTAERADHMSTGISNVVIVAVITGIFLIAGFLLLKFLRPGKSKEKES